MLLLLVVVWQLLQRQQQQRRWQRRKQQWQRLKQQQQQQVQAQAAPLSLPTQTSGWRSRQLLLSLQRVLLQPRQLDSQRTQWGTTTPSSSSQQRQRQLRVQVRLLRQGPGLPRTRAPWLLTCLQHVVGQLLGLQQQPRRDQQPAPLGVVQRATPRLLHQHRPPLQQQQQGVVGRVHSGP